MSREDFYTGSCSHSPTNYPVILSCLQSAALQCSSTKFIMWLKHSVTLILTAFICSNDKAALVYTVLIEWFK